MSTPKKGADVLAAVNPQRRRASTKIILRPDLLDEFYAADEALVAERAKPKKDRLTGEGSKKEIELAEKVRAAEDAIEAVAIHFTFEGITKPDYDALVAEHPPRKGVQIDAFLGHNRDAVDDALVRQCMVDPVFEDCRSLTDPQAAACDHKACGSWQQLLRFCNESEWQELKRACAEANQAVTEAPKSRAASLLLSRREPGSEQPDLSVSLPDDSVVESRESVTTT